MRLTRSFLLYLFASGIHQAIAFLLLPVLTYYLTPEDYGILRLYNLYVFLLLGIVSLRSENLFFVEYFTHPPAYQTRLFSTIALFPIAVATILFFILAFTAFYSNFLSEIPIVWRLMLPWFALAVFYFNLLTNLLVYTKQAQRYATVSAIKAIMEIGLSILFIVGFHWKWQGRLSAWLIVLILLCCYAFYYFSRQNFFRWKVWDKHLLIKSLKYGVPLIPTDYGKLIINQSDLLFITHLISLEATGLYSLGYQLGMILNLIGTAAIQAFSPFVMERLANKTPQSIKEIKRGFLLFLLLMVFAWGLIVLVTPLLFRWGVIHGNYEKALIYVPWSALAYLFWGIYMYFALALLFFKKTLYMSFVFISGAALNLIMNYIFINSWGTMGAAYATVLAFAWMACITAIRSYPLWKQ